MQASEGVCGGAIFRGTAQALARQRSSSSIAPPPAQSLLCMQVQAF